MSARILWACDQDGCTVSAEVVVNLAIDGAIDGNDQWPPNDWGGLGRQTLCPDHEATRMKTLIATMKDGETWFA
jgi:hypothetical protein